MPAARRFDQSSTADQVLDGIDLRGKVAIVTGASGGLGAESARALAARGAAVTLTARDTRKAEQVASAIRARTPARGSASARSRWTGRTACARSRRAGWPRTARSTCCSTTPA